MKIFTNRYFFIIFSKFSFQFVNYFNKTFFYLPFIFIQNFSYFYMIYFFSVLNGGFMKKYIMNHALQVVKVSYPDYDQNKLDEIRYGLEGIYLSITKIVVILFITFILGIFKEALMVLIFFNFLRSFAFGIHAKESWQCWISSSLVFIGIPYLCIYSNLDVYIHYILIGISVLIYLIYAPSDTVKRPLIKKHRRLKFKILTMLVSIIYVIIFIKTNDIFIRNFISFTMLLEAVLIHPFTYRVFNLPYKNYERYEISK